MMVTDEAMQDFLETTLMLRHLSLRMFALLAPMSLVVNGVMAQDITLETTPPVVVKTVPVAGSNDVDPGLQEIQVTFSKDMMDGSWSWSTMGKETESIINGKPKYLADKRTCVLPVKLAPGQTYAFWLNSAKFTNFKDTERRSAVPYLLVFRTKG